MSDTREAILDVLKKAYQIETDGFTFYSMVAERSQRQAVREIFDKLARDELQHKAYLRDIGARYQAEGVSAFAVNRADTSMRQFADVLFTDRFREQARGAEFEVSALSIGMQLESNAMATFHAAARDAADVEVREFYKFLADWERQHLDALHGLFTAVRGEIFADAGFERF